MASIRDIKRTARRDLHRMMSVPALYIVDGEAPLPVTVRVHTKFDALGQLRDGNYASHAEREDTAPRLIFWRDDIAEPKRNAVVSVEAGEAYRLGPSQPRDDQTITVHVTPLTASEAAGLPVP